MRIREELCAAGRILQHGILLTGFIPLSLNHALLFKLLTVRDPTKSQQEAILHAQVNQTNTHFMYQNRLPLDKLNLLKYFLCVVFLL